MKYYVDTCRSCDGKGAKPCACFGSGKVWRRADDEYKSAAAPALASDELGAEAEMSTQELWDRLTESEATA